MNYLSREFENLIEIAAKLKSNYQNAKPFPHIVIDNFFKEELLSEILKDFPDLSKLRNSKKYKNQSEFKFASNRGEKDLPYSIKNFLRYLNSQTFLEFLQELSSIEQPLIPDPHFLGGGLHETKRGGFLKIHTDFYKHYETGLDRRMNLLIFLNKEWDKEYQGGLEFWDKNIQTCHQNILPIFNRVVIFNTNDYSFHGVPTPLLCPSNMSRKSIAMYYYSNGRPQSEVRTTNFNISTNFVEDKNKIFPNFNLSGFVKDLIPPMAFKIYKKLFR